MTWFKIDDTFWGHQKTIEAGNTCAGMWVRCGSWASQNLTEGFIPEFVLPTLGKPREIATLVRVRLFDAGAAGCWVHDFLDYNPTKAKVLADREAAANRQRTVRSRRDSHRSHSGSHTHPVPDPYPSP